MSATADVAVGQVQGGAGAPINVEALYRQFGPAVLRRCRRMLRDEQLAMDAMQDTFVQLVRHAPRLEADRPGALLHRIATNVCLLRMRTQRRRPETLDDARIQLLCGGEDPAQVGTARAVIARVFRDESASTRQMAVLHLVDRMTLDEVAAEVGLSRSGVRKRLRGLLARAGEILGETGETAALAA